MTSPDTGNSLRCYLTLPHPCGYLSEREAVTLVVDPATGIDRALYSRLIQRGFRRSGDLVYRPHCAGCAACISLRVDTTAFRPNRSQRRVWRCNEDLDCQWREPVCDEEHFRLYVRYLAGRHTGGGMDDPTPENYRSFLLAENLETVFLDCRFAGRLVCTAVLDVLDDGLSAVYTFFDPDLPGRGLGVYAILRGIAETRRRGRPWFYLGYWIAGCRRMNYKDRFRPYQIYRNGAWRASSQSDPAAGGGLGR